MKSYRFLLATTIITLVGLGSSKGAVAAFPLQSRKSKESRSVILTAQQARSGRLSVHADSYWTPTNEDVRAVEEGLRRRLPADGAQLPSGLLDYYRQYIGIVVKHRRLIFLNGFSSGVAHEFIGSTGDWRRRPVFVFDGGNAFFHVTFDPKERRFHDFSFNGWA